MPATLPWPKIPNTPAKNGASRPSRSTYWRARNSTTAWAIVSLRTSLMLPRPFARPADRQGRATPLADVGAEHYGCRVYRPTALPGRRLVRRRCRRRAWRRRQAEQLPYREVRSPLPEVLAVPSLPEVGIAI